MPETPPPSPKMRREVGVVGLLYASLGGIIGSGWLLGPMHAAQLAGPLSVFSWIIGGGAILLLAMVYAELTTLFPRSGAMVHFPHLSHGSLLARIWSWILFLGYVAVAPAEAMAVLNYLTSLKLTWLPALVHSSAMGVNVLTAWGVGGAIAMLGVFTLLNLAGIKWAMRISNTAGWWKLGVPVLTVVVLLSTAHHVCNLHLAVAARGGYFRGMFTAIATSGVIFSYLGFRQAVALAGETSNPHRYIPLAVIGSVLIGMVLYVGLELAFLLAVNPAVLHRYGWARLESVASFGVGTGPFAALARALGLGWLAWLLYADAIVSPGGTGFIYIVTSSRVIQAMSEDGFVPRTLKKLSRAGVPWVAGLVSFAVGIVFMLPFPSWKKMVGYISLVMLLSYGIGPVVLLTLRRLMPEATYPRPYRLPAAAILAPLTFIVSNLIVYWAGATTVSILLGLLLAVFLLFLLGRAITNPRSLAEIPWRHTWWVAPYLGGIWLLDQIGSRDMVGGYGLLRFPYDIPVIAVFSVMILYLAGRCAIPLAELEAYIETQET